MRSSPPFVFIWLGGLEASHHRRQVPDCRRHCRQFRGGGCLDCRGPLQRRSALARCYTCGGSSRFGRTCSCRRLRVLNREASVARLRGLARVNPSSLYLSAPFAARRGCSRSQTRHHGCQLLNSRCYCGRVRRSAGAAVVWHCRLCSHRRRCFLCIGCCRLRDLRCLCFRRRVRCVGFLRTWWRSRLVLEMFRKHYFVHRSNFSLVMFAVGVVLAVVARFTLLGWVLRPFQYTSCLACFRFHQCCSHRFAC